MILSKLQGYNPVTQQYTNGQGQVVDLPMPGFVVGTSVPVNYDDFGTTPEAWDKYGSGQLGDVVGFKDWMCLRAEIKTLILAITGNDFANWDDLTAVQKEIAERYIPTKIIDAKGSPFFMQQCGGLYEGQRYLDNYQTLADQARAQRLKTFGDFGYYGLGKDQGLHLERIYQQLSLDRAYTIRGILFEAEDTVPGIGDWVYGTNSYAANGLKPLLLAGTYTLLSGFPYTIDQFCDVLAQNILNNGNY